jgi:hypothetical protein
MLLLLVAAPPYDELLMSSLNMLSSSLNESASTRKVMRWRATRHNTPLVSACVGFFGTTALTGAFAIVVVGTDLVCAGVGIARAGVWVLALLARGEAGVFALPRGDVGVGVFALPRGDVGVGVLGTRRGDVGVGVTVGDARAGVAGTTPARGESGVGALFVAPDLLAFKSCNRPWNSLSLSIGTCDTSTLAMISAARSVTNHFDARSRLGLLHVGGRAHRARGRRRRRRLARRDSRQQRLWRQIGRDGVECSQVVAGRRCEECAITQHSAASMFALLRLSASASSDAMSSANRWLADASAAGTGLGAFALNRRTTDCRTDSRPSSENLTKNFLSLDAPHESCIAPGHSAALSILSFDVLSRSTKDSDDPSASLKPNFFAT